METKKITCKGILELLIFLAVVFVLTFFVIRYVGQRTLVEGNSMEPALHDGDNLIVDKISYRYRKPERYDIIVFPYQKEEGTYFIKRLIGLPGETVRIDQEGHIYINGDRIMELYGKEVMQNPRLAVNEITLGEDEYFVLGDNRNNSTDSRDERVGLVKRDNILGKAWVRIYPFDQFGKILHQ